MTRRPPNRRPRGRPRRAPSGANIDAAPSLPLVGALPWLAALAFYFAFPDYLGFGAELLIAMLFALSLDLALGYAGIITLGHAAFFGTGAYTVGMLAYYGIWTEPIVGLLCAAWRRA